MTKGIVIVEINRLCKEYNIRNPYVLSLEY